MLTLTTKQKRMKKLTYLNLSGRHQLINHGLTHNYCDTLAGLLYINERWIAKMPSTFLPDTFLFHKKVWKVPASDLQLGVGTDTIAPSRLFLRAALANSLFKGSEDGDRRQMMALRQFGDSGWDIVSLVRTLNLK